MKISFAAAGTAGHIEPALAVARWLKIHEPSARCEFIGTAAALDSSLLLKSGFTLHPITKAPFPRHISGQIISWPFKFIRSFMQIWQVLDESDLVVGFGGYVCAPTYIVAKIRKVPILIHEANVLPGMANELGRKLGAKTTIAFASTKSQNKKWSSAELVGMPLRESIKNLAHLSSDERRRIRGVKTEQWNFDPLRPIVLVFGGSQGSLGINTVIQEILPQTDMAGIQILHAVGKANDLPARSRNYLPVHYIDDMGEAMVAADLAITRGGAVTCAELGILQTYGVIIPLAIGNGEQSENARELSDIGAAVVVPSEIFTARYLSEHFIGFVRDAEKFRLESKSPAFSLDAEEKLGEIIRSIVRTGQKR